MYRLRANSFSWYLQEKCIVLNNRHMPWEELLFLIKPIWSGSMIRGHNFFKWKASSLKGILQSTLISDQGLQDKQKSEAWLFFMGKEHCPCLRGNPGEEILLGQRRKVLLHRTKYSGLITALPFLRLSFNSVFTGCLALALGFPFFRE